ncbi:hypothetical protein N9B41_00890 [bacterium]|nr:hypothetical protein [bacterium]MDB4545317.1 hypothetical protein [bacterium]
MILAGDMFLLMAINTGLNHSSLPMPRSIKSHFNTLRSCEKQIVWDLVLRMNPPERRHKLATRLVPSSETESKCDDDYLRGVRDNSSNAALMASKSRSVRASEVRTIGLDHLWHSISKPSATSQWLISMAFLEASSATC